jgi:DNA repair protein RadC
MKNCNTLKTIDAIQKELFLSNVAEVKVSYSTKVPARDRRQITSSQDAEEIFRLSWDLETIESVESMKLLLLNRANRVLGIVNLSTGGTSGCVVDVKVLFQHALLAHASAIIMAHSHPSGNSQPSAQDISITKKVKEGGAILDISLLDHIILTPYDGFYSMADEGDI